MSLIDGFLENAIDQINDFDYVGTYNRINLDNVYDPHSLLHVLSLWQYIVFNKGNDKESHFLTSLRMLLTNDDCQCGKADLLYIVSHLERLKERWNKKKSVDNLSTMYS